MQRALDLQYISKSVKSMEPLAKNTAHRMKAAVYSLPYMEDIVTAENKPTQSMCRKKIWGRDYLPACWPLMPSSI